MTAHTDLLIGQFIFPKSILIKQGLLSNNGQGGKRAIRVYPPWYITDNTQAKKAQAWQAQYFVEIHPNVNVEKVKTLLEC